MKPTIEPAISHPPCTPANKKRVGLHELALGREFLNQRSDRRPEHPEAGGDQRVHQVELPDSDAMLESKDAPP